jgi:hypothetical protein
MTMPLNFRRNGARMIVALAVLLVYQGPVTQPTSMLLPTAQAIPQAPVAPSVAVPAGPTVASADTEAPPVIPLADPFAATSWGASERPAAPPTPVSARAAAGPARPTDPAPPAAPPLPFVYVGRYVEGGRQIVMLMRGDQLLLLQQGDTVDNTYRVERIATDRIELTYLPLGMRQSVRVSDSV